MHATSVNPIDVILRAGHLAQFLPMALPVILAGTLSVSLTRSVQV